MELGLRQYTSIRFKRALPEYEQDLVIAGLLRRLSCLPSALHPFRPLSAVTEYWSDQTLADLERWTYTGLVRERLRLFKAVAAHYTQ